MFTVEHQKTHKKLQYGKDHLSIFLNIEVKDVNGIIKELGDIDSNFLIVYLRIKSI